MKHKFLLTMTLLSALSLSALAGDYENYIKEAESASLEKRMELWLKAADSTTDNTKKLTMFRQAYELAKRINDERGILYLADTLYKFPGVPAEEKLEARYRFLVTSRSSAKKNISYEGRYVALQSVVNGVSPQDYISFLKVPGITAEQEKKISLLLASILHDYDFWYQEIAMRRKLLERKDLTSTERQDQYLILSNIYLSMNNMEESVKSLRSLLAIKSLTPDRRIRTLIILGDTLRKGYGWYYYPNAEQYKEMSESYKSAMNLAAKRRRGGYYNQALLKMIEGAHFLEKSEEVVKLCARYINNNKLVDGITWKKAKTLEGTHLLKLNRCPEAIVVFEELYKYKHDLSNTCMSLGQSYYLNDDFAMALGMYDEAIVELGMDDSARPAQCKRWCQTLRGLLGKKDRLTAVYLARAKRLNEEAKAAGKESTVKVNAPDSLNPFANQKVPKKKPKTMDDLMNAAEESPDLLGGGLDLE